MLTLQRILLPVDFSEQCAGAGRYAKALASQFQSQLVLLHAIPRPHIDYGGEVSTSILADLATKTRTSAGHMLDTFLADELRTLTVQRLLVEGDAAQQIVTYAHTEQIDLIMTPTHGYGPFRRFLTGSVVAKVLHDADCPVWTGVHLEDAPIPESLSFRRIACAVDLGPHSEAVLSWAAGIATAFGGRLVVFHVTAPVTIAVTGGIEPEPDVERAERARGEMADLVAKTGVTAEIAVDSGDVAQTVYDFAARLPADLLVIGRGAAKGIVGRLRSHAYAIIRESPCAVVSV